MKKKALKWLANILGGFVGAAIVVTVKYLVLGIN